MSVTDEMMERARAAYRSTQFYPIVPGNHDNALRAALEAAASSLERELDETQTLRHKAEYHAGVLEAQNVVLRRELKEAQEKIQILLKST